MTSAAFPIDSVEREIDSAIFSSISPVAPAMLAVKDATCIIEEHEKKHGIKNAVKRKESFLLFIF